MKKQPTDMYSSESLIDLTTFRSGIRSGDGELVIACGYTVDGQYGYFICEEIKTTHKDKRPMWIYTNQRSFDKKINERTYHEVLNKLKTMVAN